MRKLVSTQKLYSKIAKGEMSGFTVPAFNIRTLTLDISRALFRAAKKEKVGAFIIELAKSEMEYTDQSPEEYKKTILKASDRERFEGPIFLQGDHFKIDRKKYFSKTEKKRELENLEDLTKKAIEAGFYNIDIDCSSLPIEENFTETAKFTAFIRKLEPKDLTISIGGEVGEIGGKNTTVEEFRKFMNGYKDNLMTILRQLSIKPIIKTAVQTGTSHGGILLPSGELKVMEEDFETLKKLSQEAKKYGMAGAVQHGASTLPEQYFKKFPETGACEIHLATIFQNIIYDSDYFPQGLKEKIYQWLKKNYQKKETENEIQFLYRNRKRALGIFKKEIWSIPQKNIDKICEELEEKFTFFFRELNVSNTSDLITSIYS